MVGQEIDMEARRRGLRPEGRTNDEIADIMNRNEDHDRNGMVLGDETRLTQILTNLVKYVHYLSVFYEFCPSDHTFSVTRINSQKLGGRSVLPLNLLRLEQDQGLHVPIRLGGH